MQVSNLLARLSLSSLKSRDSFKKLCYTSGEVLEKLVLFWEGRVSLDGWIYGISMKKKGKKKERRNEE